MKDDLRNRLKQIEAKPVPRRVRFRVQFLPLLIMGLIFAFIIILMINAGCDRVEMATFNDNIRFVRYILYAIVFLTMASAAWGTSSSYNLLRKGMPVIGKVIGIEKVMAGRYGTSNLWVTTFMWEGKIMSRKFSGDETKPDELLVLIDPDNVESCNIYWDSVTDVWELV